MPIFEYKCDRCGQQFEQLVFRSSDKVSCTACGSEEVQKYVSTFASNAFAGDSSASCSTGSCGKKSSFG
ncbi:Regulatory protein, FmdB family [Candidatus Zixiibacteriota bacterium]|nr:Regulatory protein, FmdB family [candidate division Zixibacteria bacterium]